MILPDEGWAVGGDCQYGLCSGVILHYKNGVWTNAFIPVNQQFDDIAMVTADEGWVVGKAGTILHYNGKTWAPALTPVRYDLHSISMISADEGWAVGNKGTVLHYSGGSWHTMASPTDEDLQAIAMATEDYGLAAGSNGIVLRYRDKAPDLSLSAKETESIRVTPGQTVSYTITLANTGTGDATNVRLTDTLPLSLTYQAGSLWAGGGSYGEASGVITWTGAIAAGAATTVRYATVVSPALPVSDTVALVNTVWIDDGINAPIKQAVAVFTNPFQAWLPLTAR